MKEIETKLLGAHVPLEIHALIRKVSKARGEGMSSFVRRAILKELASLNFISDDKKKALGI